MIDINAQYNENTVFIRINIDRMDDLWFSNSEGPNKIWNKILCTEINKKFSQEIERIRRQMYNIGWEDAKKRRKKKVYFSSWLNDKKNEDVAWED